MFGKDLEGRKEGKKEEKTISVKLEIGFVINPSESSETSLLVVFGEMMKEA